jgi:NAD+ synthase
MSILAQQISLWLRERATQAHARGFVVGLSGGIDSAVVARLCQLALPGAVAGVIMPCCSDPVDEADARLVAKTFELSVVDVPLDGPYDALRSTVARALGGLPQASQPAATPEPAAAIPLAAANLKPRLRMATLYYVANSLNYLVAGTGNRSELSVGYFTKYGDGGVDVLPLGGLVKSQVRTLAAALGVPARIIEKPPGAGLWLGQTDEAEMGFTYEDLEQYLSRGPESVAPALAMRIERLMRRSDHKRATPPIGPGR